MLGKLAGGNLEVRRNPRVNAQPVRNRIAVAGWLLEGVPGLGIWATIASVPPCLLYTSDAADE